MSSKSHGEPPSPKETRIPMNNNTSSPLRENLDFFLVLAVDAIVATRFNLSALCLWTAADTTEKSVRRRLLHLTPC